MLFSLIAFGLNDNYNFFFFLMHSTHLTALISELGDPRSSGGDLDSFYLFYPSPVGELLPSSPAWPFSIDSSPNFNGKTMNMRILSLTISKYLLMLEISFSGRHVISPSLQTQARIYYSWWPARLPSSQLCGLLCPNRAEFIVTFNDRLINLKG